MKKNILIAVFAITSPVFAAQHTFQGSDTLAGMMTDAIIAAGMQNELVYSGGGSGLGEKGILSSQQGIAPMSRAVTPEAVEKARQLGIEFVPNVIALDGLGIFVNKANKAPGIDLDTIRKIFLCQITDWSEIQGSGLSGKMAVYRRNDNSGTTDAFKTMVGVKKFGDCVTPVAETGDIAEKTEKDSLAIGYAGITATREKNRPLAISQSGTVYVEINVNTVRDRSYPLARELYVYTVKGAREPNATEKKFMQSVLDRSFMDPIVQDHEFFTID